MEKQKTHIPQLSEMYVRSTVYQKTDLPLCYPNRVAVLVFYKCCRSLLSRKNAVFFCQVQKAVASENFSSRTVLANSYQRSFSKETMRYEE